MPTLGMITWIAAHVVTPVLVAAVNLYYSAIPSGTGGID